MVTDSIHNHKWLASPIIYIWLLILIQYLPIVKMIVAQTTSANSWDGYSLNGVCVCVCACCVCVVCVCACTRELHLQFSLDGRCPMKKDYRVVRESVVKRLKFANEYFHRTHSFSGHCHI